MGVTYRQHKRATSIYTDVLYICTYTTEKHLHNGKTKTDTQWVARIASLANQAMMMTIN